MRRAVIMSKSNEPAMRTGWANMEKYRGHVSGTVKRMLEQSQVQAVKGKHAYLWMGTDFDITEVLFSE